MIIEVWIKSERKQIPRSKEHKVYKRIKMEMMVIMIIGVTGPIIIPTFLYACTCMPSSFSLFDFSCQLRVRDYLLFSKLIDIGNCWLFKKFLLLYFICNPSAFRAPCCYQTSFLYH